MCLLLSVYCILYTCFGGSPTGEADKIGKKFKKSICSSVPLPHGRSEHNYHVADLPHGSYVHQRTDKHKANMAPGSTRAYVAYVHQAGETDERKGLRFIGPTYSTNVS
jgi:hypothetical protein